MVCPSIASCAISELPLVDAPPGPHLAIALAIRKSAVILFPPAVIAPGARDRCLIMPARPSNLSGLSSAIRLKTDLLHRVATHPSAEWPDDIERFIAAVESCDLEDTTALVVLLAVLKEEMGVFIGHHGRGEPVSEPGPASLATEASSKREILAQFRREATERLMAPVRHHAIVSPVVERTMHFIDDNYTERLTLDAVAAAVGRSKRHVATLFRQQTGQTIHHYLTQVRVHHAAALIRQREKVEAVSLLVGYRSKKNFYLHFKQQIGVTPGVYKEVLIGLAPLADREPAVERQPKS